MTITITFPLPLGFLPYPKQPRACVVLFANASHSHESKQAILFFFLRCLSQSVSQQQCKAQKPAPCCWVPRFVCTKTLKLLGRGAQDLCYEHKSNLLEAQERRRTEGTQTDRQTSDNNNPTHLLCVLMIVSMRCCDNRFACADGLSERLLVGGSSQTRRRRRGSWRTYEARELLRSSLRRKRSASVVPTKGAKCVRRPYEAGEVHSSSIYSPLWGP
jgi:hypothetical protein